MPDTSLRLVRRMDQLSNRVACLAVPDVLPCYSIVIRSPTSGSSAGGGSRQTPSIYQVTMQRMKGTAVGLGSVEIRGCGISGLRVYLVHLERIEIIAAWYAR